MRPTTRRLALAAALALTTQFAGCWFVFIPGSLMTAAADALTGSEGDHCVGREAKVGDTVTTPTGAKAVVKSISGASGRCTDPAWPIRAAVQ